MSSEIFSADLHPDAGLRRLLACWSLLALLGGTAILLCLPVPPALRTLAAAGWAFCMILGYVGRRSRQQQLQRIRVYADGTAQLLSPDGAWSYVAVRGDSVVLNRLAWLRLEYADGHRHAELLRGDSRESEDWRRFHVIWKHVSRQPQSRLGSSS